MSENFDEISFKGVTLIKENGSVLRVFPDNIRQAMEKQDLIKDHYKFVNRRVFDKAFLALVVKKNPAKAISLIETYLHEKRIKAQETNPIHN